MTRPGRRRPDWRHHTLHRMLRILATRPDLAGIHPHADLLAEHTTLVSATDIREEPVTHHQLKTSPACFEATWTGAKTFEVRFDDRGYQRGDTVLLREWDRRSACDCENRTDHDTRTCARYSGRELSADVGHVLASTPPSGQQRGFCGHGYVVLSLCNPQHHDRRAAPPIAPAAPTPLLLGRKG